MLFRCEFCTTKKKPARKNMFHATVLTCEKLFDAQLTIIPNRTPMTKSQTVMHTMMLTMVRYSVLHGKTLYICLRGSVRTSFTPADPMPRIPECLLYKIETKDEDQCPYNHHSCNKKLERASLCEKESVRMKAIGPVPINSRAVVAAARRNPAMRVVPPTR